MEIVSDEYRINYDPATHAILLAGSLRLRGMAEYAPVIEMLDRAVHDEPETIVLDLRDLQFLNSSGINMLFRFVIDVRERKKSRIVVKGTIESPWQQKSLENLQKLMPELQLDWGE
ncbi:MAG: slr1659 superfamily regulator [Candidatus Micrarchaeota archaeon]